MIGGSLFLTVSLYHTLAFAIISFLIVRFGTEEMAAMGTKASLIVAYFTLEIQLIVALAILIRSSIVISFYKFMTWRIERKLK